MYILPQLKENATKLFEEAFIPNINEKPFDGSKDPTDDGTGESGEAGMSTGDDEVEKSPEDAAAEDEEDPDYIDALNDIKEQDEIDTNHPQ